VEYLTIFILENKSKQSFTTFTRVSCTWSLPRLSWYWTCDSVWL